MTLWSRIKSASRNLFSQQAVDQDLDEEVRAFVDMSVDEKVRSGVSSDAARRSTLAELGGAERLKTSVRESRNGIGLQSLAQDIRYGVRQMSRSAGFATTVILTLALTIGITAAVFSVLYAMLIRPLPYRHTERIVVLDTRSSSGGTQAASYPEYADWRRMSHSFDALAGFDPGHSVSLENSEGASALQAVAGTDNFFSVFGVSPILGRTFLPAEDQDGKNDVVVLSYEVWQHSFAGHDSVIGQTIRLDGRKFTVIGVMPAGFRFPINEVNAVYFPLHMTHVQRYESRGGHWLQTIARLQPGVTSASAEADLTAIFNNLGRTDLFNAGRTVKAVDLTTYVVGQTDSSLRLLLYAVLAVLAIGCVNIAGLMLAHGVKREREMALRSAIGATRVRIVRQVLTEALLFAVSGAAGGIVLGYTLLRLIRLLLISSLSRGAEVELNLPVLLAALFVSVTVTVIAGLIPALRLSATAPSLSLKSGGNTGATRGQHRLRSAFVVTQVALALALAVVSGLLMHMLGGLRNTELGFNANNILTTEITLPSGRYENTDISASFYQPLFEKILALPGVKSVGYVQMIPLQAWGWNSEHIHIVGTPPLKNPRTVGAETRFVSAGYYQVFQQRLLRGRLVDPTIDQSSTRLVTVVNEAFVKQFIPPGRDAVGMEIGDDDSKDISPDSKNPRILIVGVVKNMRQSLYLPPMPQMDFLAAQIPAHFDAMIVLGRTHLVIRADVGASALTSSVRRAIHDVDPSVPFRTLDSMQTIIADVLTFERLENWLFGAFAALAVVLAIVGLYGLISHEIELSARDIGVRLALGAARSTILSGVYRRVGLMLGGGVVIGMLVTTAARRYINSVVAIQVERDGLRILSLAALLVCAGLIAAYLPARRASAIEPMRALRDE